MSNKRGYRLLWAIGAGMAAMSLLVLTTGCWEIPPVEPLAATADASPATGTAPGPVAVTLTATATGGTAPYTYAWSCSPSVTITDSTLASASASLTTAGTYTFTVAVTDAAAGSQTATATVTIAAAPGPSVNASASSSTPTAGQTIQLLATVTGGSGSPTFSWLQTNSTAGATITNATSQTATVAFSTTASGQFDFSVTVTDSTGSDTASTSVTVTAITNPLIVEAGTIPAARSVPGGGVASTIPPLGGAGVSFLNGSVTQAGANPADLTYAWTNPTKPTGSGTVSILSPNNAQSAWTIGFPAIAGDYVFQLLGTNLSTGESTPDPVTVTLIDVPVVRLAAGELTRRHVMPDALVVYNLEYIMSAATTANFYF